MKDFIHTFNVAKTFSLVLLWSDDLQEYFAYYHHRADLELIHDFRDHTFNLNP